MIPIICMSCGARGDVAPEGLTSLASRRCGCGSDDFDMFDGQVVEASIQTEAVDDFGPGSGGVMGLIRGLAQWFRGHEPGSIPPWFPKRLLLPEEIKSGKFIESGIYGAFASKTASDDAFNEAVRKGLMMGTSEYINPGAMLPSSVYVVLEPGPNGARKTDRKTSDREEANRWARELLDQHPDGFPRTSKTAAWGDGLVGRQMLGMPGSEILAVTPTGDYLTNGPVGDGWYEPSEGRYVTTDFLVQVRLGDGRVVQIPKSHDWVKKNQGGSGVTAAKTDEACCASGEMKTEDCEEEGICCATGEQMDEHCLNPRDTHKESALRRHADKLPLVCGECGKKFKRNVGPSSSPKCPKCGGYDVEPDYESGFPLRGSLRVAGYGIFRKNDRTPVYGPVSKRNAEIALIGGRYPEDEFFIGEMPDQTNDVIPHLRPGAPEGETPVYEPDTVTAKVHEMTAGILQANPGLGEDGARKLALMTIGRYPHLVEKR